MQNLPEATSSSTHSLPDRFPHRLWILGRIATLLGHYWREDDPAEMTEAMGRDWADILEGLPQSAIASACMDYLRDQPKRKPTPGAIYALAREKIPRPASVTPVLRIVDYQAGRERVTAEAAAEIMKHAGFKPKKMGNFDE